VPGGLRHGLERKAALPQKTPKVPCQYKPLGEPSERTKRRIETHHVEHDRCAVIALVKVVIVLEGLECAADHAILEVPRRLKRGNAARQSLSHAQVTRFPSDFISEFEQSAAAPGNGFLAAGSGRLNMGVDAASQIEAA
jgi:hypothetical protein